MDEEAKCEHCGMPMSQCVCNKGDMAGDMPQGGDMGAGADSMPPQQ